MSLEWVYPQALLLLLLLPVYGWWLARAGRGSGRGLRSLSFARVTALRAAGGGAGRVLGLLPEVLRALVLVLLVVALARPRTAAAVVEDTSDGVPIVVALDISSSMLAQDFQPRDRLEVAKQTTAEFVRSRSADPVGLVAFAGEALTLVPITGHQPVLLNALSSLRVGLLEDGTAIGDGLAAAVNRLRRVPAESRVVVLLSDGENNRGEVDPLAAAQAAQAFGVTVFTVGVGSEGVAQVPVRREAEGFEYVELPVGIDEDLLREIAQITGGRYFRATNPEALESIYRQIDELVQSPLEVRSYFRYSEWYLPLLLAATFLLLAEWLLRGSRWGRVP